MILAVLFTRLLIIISMVSLMACVMGEGGRRITEQDAAWIEKDRTTREQVITKFGEPALTGTYQGVGEYAEYVVPPLTRLPLQPMQSGPLPQVHRPPIERTVPQSEPPEVRFWVIYNVQGLVKDFGFGSPPKR